ncbi:MAG: alpha-E domain-containing protein [Alphaproteobacteria bacterium]|nr:alpha-E domain-containing protein [Alphaproteobacteria bacterium]
MLGRMADNLYWMARYVDRAETLARLLESTHTVSLMPTAGAEQAEWRALLDVSDRDSFAERYDRPTQNAVISHLVLNPANPSSILSCFGGCRENARATRHMLTTELWEAINQTWLEVKDLTYARLLDIGQAEFFEWVRNRAEQIQGVAAGTMRRDDGTFFLRLGSMIERADGTARTLRLRRLAPQAEVVDYYRWGAMLRSFSAFKAYREIHRGGIEPRKVADLLIFRHDVPRSLHFCMDGVTRVLDRLRPAAACARLAGRLHADLHYGSLDELDDAALDALLDDVILRNNALGTQIQKDFMMIRQGLAG